jgi:hypothetical protein
MPILRTEVTHHLTSDVPKDFCTNTVYHNNDTVGGLLPADYQNHANEMRDLFAGVSSPHNQCKLYNGRQILVKVYDMSDPHTPGVPRPVRASATWNPGSPDSPASYGPHQVALRLSYYADRNLKGYRGGIYMGPLPYTFLQGPVTTYNLANLIDFGHGLFDIGGQNVQHVLYKVADGSHKVITDYWADNGYDVQRRRKTAATARQILHP